MIRRIAEMTPYCLLNFYGIGSKMICGIWLCSATIAGRDEYN